MGLARLRRVARHVTCHTAPHPTPHSVSVYSPHAAAAAAAAHEEGDELRLPQRVLDDFVRDGYVLLQGLIPEPVRARAEAHAWEMMAGRQPVTDDDPYGHLEHHGVVERADRSSWPDGAPWHGLTTDPAIGGIVAPAFESAVRQLVGAMAAADRARPLRTSALPGQHRRERFGFLNAFPAKSPSEWQMPDAGHVDISDVESEASLINLDQPPDDGAPARRVASLLSISYLTSAVAEGGGGTVVWPTSHRLLRERYSEVWEATWREAEPLAQLTVLQDIASAAVPLTTAASWSGPPPVEIVPEPGSVLLYDYLCVHTSSANVRATPRLAVSKKW